MKEIVSLFLREESRPAGVKGREMELRNRDAYIDALDNVFGERRIERERGGCGNPIWGKREDRAGSGRAAGARLARLAPFARLALPDIKY
jgi:hypothetical protein